MKYQLIGLLSPSRPVYKWRRAFWGRAGARTFVLFSSCQLQELACSLGGVYVFVRLVSRYLLHLLVFLLGCISYITAKATRVDYNV